MMKEYFTDILRYKYSKFTGRASRKEYWMFFLFFCVFVFMFAVLDDTLGLKGVRGVGILGLIFYLAVFIPSVAIAVRRLHDTDKSGWWMFFLAIPGLGSIIILIFMLLNSTPGANKYGPNPYEVSNPDIPTPLIPLE